MIAWDRWVVLEETMWWLPMLTLSVGRIITDRALLAVFMVVYDNPCSCKLTRKSSTVFKGGLYELTSVSSKSHAIS